MLGEPSRELSSAKINSRVLFRIYSHSSSNLKLFHFSWDFIYMGMHQEFNDDIHPK